MPEELYSPNSGCIYRIRGFLGRGGSGCIYRVFCLSDGRFYALKVSNEDELSRVSLRREGRILTDIVYAAFPSVKEIWEGEKKVYLVMTYISGRTLAMQMEEHLLWGESGFEPDVVLPWMLQLAECLEYLHKHRMIYRDLKPSNVMIDSKGQLFIVDFGAACYRGEEIMAQGMGTPGFAPPEQYSHVSGPGIWTDIYSFGALMHFLLTGENSSEHLFQFRKLSECHQAEGKLEQKDKAVRIRQIQILEQLIKVCTAREPEKRCHSWKRIRHDLYYAQSRVLQRQKQWFRQFILGAMAVFLVVYLVLMRGYGQLDKELYDQCLIKAESGDPQEAEELILKAITLVPEKAEAYEALYALFMQDGTISSDEWQKIQPLLLLNKAHFDSKDPEWVILDYKIGIALYFQSEKQISGSQAAVWFQNVEEADMQRMNLGEYDARKYIWQKRAAIFKRWSMVEADGENQEEAEKINRQFWRDADLLLDDDFYPEEVIWELEMYDRILSRMMGELMVGINGHIVSEKEIDVIFDKMNHALEQVSEEKGTHILQERILEKERVLKKRLMLIQ